MAIFGRKREDGPGAPASEAPGAPAPVGAGPAARDPDLGVPPYRPVAKDTQAVPLPPKPAAATTPGSRPLAGAPPAAPGAAPVPQRPGRAAMPEPAERRTLVVGRGISLQGTVSDAERLVVEGTVESAMIQASEVFVAPSGVFRGEVQVEDAEIAGLFDGTITVRGNLVIRATGQVNGTARYRKLSVEEGGTLSGRMETLTAEAAAAPPPPRPVAPAVADAEA